MTDPAHNLSAPSLSSLRLIYHVDDSPLARRILPELLKGQPYSVRSFSSVDAIIAVLKNPNEPLPWLILCDFNMPQKSGAEFLDWVKRQPNCHQLPIVFLSAEVDAAQALVNPLYGAFGLIKKPFQLPELAPVFERLNQCPAMKPESRKSLEEAFANENLESLEDWTTAFASTQTTLPLEALNDLYRHFHTVKGGALSLDFPTLGRFIHEAEAFVKTALDKKLNQIPEVRGFLLKLIADTVTHLEEVRGSKILSSPSPALVEELQTWMNTTKLGLTLGAPASSENFPPAQDPSSAGGAKSRGDSIRIPHAKLDELQAQLKAMVQIRARLSQFANNLSGEFSDESFPRDLQAMVDSLAKANEKALEFFIGLRVVSASTLKDFCDAIISQTASFLNKSVTLNFSAEAGLEFDQPVMETLQGTLTHLIRNSIDHGIETKGALTVNLKREGSTSFTVEVADNGKGIDREGLRKAIVKKGLMTAEVAAQIPADGVLDLIFVEGLSTQDTATAISGRGVGMGAVKEQIVKLGGQIKVASTPGSGTQFFITLPRIFKL